MNNYLLLTYKEKKKTHPLINDVLKKNGVKFNLISEKDAIPYLESNNYYYKLACYRKNFNRDFNGKYLDLDFQHLINISKLDKRIRYSMIQLTLEIEHNLKTLLLNKITQNDDIDGYEIVHNFIDHLNSSRTPDDLLTITYFIKTGSSNISLRHGIYQKVSKNNNYIAIWQLLELLEFYNLQKFFKFYFTKYPDDQINTSNLSSLYGLLHNVRNIRNAAAHNTPLLSNVSAHAKDAFKNNNQPNRQNINSLVRDDIENANVSQAVIPTYRFIDFTNTFKMYKILFPNSNCTNDILLSTLQYNLINHATQNIYPEKLNDLNLFFKSVEKIFNYYF